MHIFFIWCGNFGNSDKGAYYFVWWFQGLVGRFCWDHWIGTRILDILELSEVLSILTEVSAKLSEGFTILTEDWTILSERNFQLSKRREFLTELCLSNVRTHPKNRTEMSELYEKVSECFFNPSKSGKFAHFIQSKASFSA